MKGTLLDVSRVEVEECVFLRVEIFFSHRVHTKRAGNRYNGIKNPITPTDTFRSEEQNERVSLMSQMSIDEVSSRVARNSEA